MTGNLMRMSQLKRACAAALVVASLGGTTHAVAQALPEAEVTFNVAGRTFTGGDRVTMSGTIEPGTTGETIRLETQVYKRGAWRAYDVKRTDVTARDAFRYVHDRFPAGFKYRTRALWSETGDHLSGRTVWDPFRVERKTR